MSLPASQQHTLDAIDDRLRHGDPRLARMFAVFTRLTRQEGMPAAETLPARQWWARSRPNGPGRGRGPRARRNPASLLAARLIVPLLLAAALSLLIMSILASPSAGQRRCGRAASPNVAFRLMTPASCAPAAPPGAAQVAK